MNQDILARSLSAHTAHKAGSSRHKIVLVVIFFAISLVAFVVQTEATSYLYSPKVGFNEPYLLLFLTHGSWALLWPAQLVLVAVYRSRQRRESSPQLLGSATETVEEPSVAQHVRREVQVVYKISEAIYNDAHGLSVLESHLSDAAFAQMEPQTFATSAAVRHIVRVGFVNTVIITCASLTWYVAMVYSYSNDITAIYNCSAFFAYLFAIVLLGEAFSWLKFFSVNIAICGVLVVVYSKSSAAEAEKPHRFFGNVLIAAGAVCYGLYDVYYKKYLCPPLHRDALFVTPAQQARYSNFVCSVTGVFSALILAVLLVAMHVLGIRPLRLLYPLSTWFYIAASLLANISYSASMLVLYALTSPVLGAVSSLTTIFLVGLFEWVVFGNTLSFWQLCGDFLVIVGFGILSVAYWNEIADDDE